MSQPPATPKPRRFLPQACARPRRMVVLCFLIAFAISLVLAGRQYYQLQQHELEIREHNLQLQALAIETVVFSGKSQLQFLRHIAERLLIEAHVQPAMRGHEAVLSALRNRQQPLWGLTVPKSDAPVLAISDAAVADIHGLSRDPQQLEEDLHLSRVMSQVLPAQFQGEPNLARIMFLANSGIVVAYPALRDEQLEPILRKFASSPLMSLNRANAEDLDIAFYPMPGTNLGTMPHVLLSTPVYLNAVMRGALIYDVPQTKLQSYLYQTTGNDEQHALIDNEGNLVASSDQVFKSPEGSWLSSLPDANPRLSLPMLFQRDHGTIKLENGYLQFRELQGIDLMLTNYISATDLRAAVNRQIDILFYGVWLLLALLMILTLYIVDRLFKGQLRLNRQLREMGLVDGLTQLANRRRLQSDFGGLLQRLRDDQPVALWMLDIDRFKNINDTWGHSAGDEVIKHLATLCRALVRPQDLVVRYGGEEFCVLMPDTTLADATLVAERLRTATAQSVCVPEASTLLAGAPSLEIRLTVSIGVAELRGDNCQGLEDLVATADRRLYAAKKGGRNQVINRD
ncbi:diguanylate cyclase [Pseudomonas sp. H9]|uniref:diguanylate cyclase n=1 Tax=Pseudomonas sp. H9 TaxID=483968 RepID=UPI001057A1F8|nr:diguanylate cyclase [Pseudomonas sp. H9]TDF80842.1 diguanylate cyclase [Pseudomonas sp. H9]